MPYTTQAELELAAGGASRFKQLADWDNDTVVDAGVIAQAQSEADGFIDSHLRNFSPADLVALRAAPTASIKRLAAAETIFWLREKRQGVSEGDLDLRKMRVAELQAMHADELRPADSRTERARFVDNDDDVSREGTKGMW